MQGTLLRVWRRVWEVKVDILGGIDLSSHLVPEFETHLLCAFLSCTAAATEMIHRPPTEQPKSSQNMQVVLH